MSANYISGIVAFLGGAVIAVINSLMIAKQVQSESGVIAGTMIVRQILGFVYLAAVFFVARKLDLDVTWPLIGAAAGLTIPSILFAFTIAKHLKGDD